MPERERVYLSLGSNIEPERHLADALGAISARFGAVECSGAYRNQAVGFAGAEFVNLAAALDSELAPTRLAQWLRALESAHGRCRVQPRFADRSLDIDIVLFGRRSFRIQDGLQLPRPELEQAFVLKPLADLAPDLVPAGGSASLAALWAGHPQAGLACWRRSWRFWPAPDTPPTR